MIMIKILSISVLIYVTLEDQAPHDKTIEARNRQAIARALVSVGWSLVAWWKGWL